MKKPANCPLCHELTRAIVTGYENNETASPIYRVKCLKCDILGPGDTIRRYSIDKWDAFAHKIAKVEELTADLSPQAQAYLNTP